MMFQLMPVVCLLFCGYLKEIKKINRPSDIVHGKIQTEQPCPKLMCFLEIITGTVTA